MRFMKNNSANSQQDVAEDPEVDEKRKKAFGQRLSEMSEAHSMGTAWGRLSSSGSADRELRRQNSYDSRGSEQKTKRHRRTGSQRLSSQERSSGGDDDEVHSSSSGSSQTDNVSEAASPAGQNKAIHPWGQVPSAIHSVSSAESAEFDKRSSQCSIPSVESAETVIARNLVQLTERFQTSRTRTDWINSGKGEAFFGVAILLNSVLVGIEVDMNTGPDSNPVMWVFEALFITVFIIEIILRVKAEGLEYFSTRWGIFDTTVNVISLPAKIVAMTLATESGDGGFAGLRVVVLIKMLRLARIIKVVRYVRKMKELRILVRVLGDSLRIVSWMALLGFGILYSGSLFTTVLLGQSPALKDNESVQEYYGSILRSLYSHLMVAQAEGWTGAALTAIDNSDEYGAIWAMYFILLLGLLHFTLLSIITGTITQNIITMAAEDREVEGYLTFQSAEDLLGTIFETLVAGRGDSSLLYTELRRTFINPEARSLLELCKVHLTVDGPALLAIFDREGTGKISRDDFLVGCMRLQSAKSSAQVFHFFCDALVGFRRLGNDMEDVLNALQPKSQDHDELTAALDLQALLREGSKKATQILTFKDNVRLQYTGTVVNQLPHGLGTMVFIDGTVCRGQFRRGLAEGNVNITWTDGSNYRGIFHNDRAHGEGVLLRCDGSIYRGQFEHDVMSGNGTISWPDGSNYKGTFKGNKRSGRGTMIWRTGYWRSYEGQWLGGLQDGLGILVNDRGQRHCGMFDRGQPVKWLGLDVFQGNAIDAALVESFASQPSIPKIPLHHEPLPSLLYSLPMASLDCRNSKAHDLPGRSIEGGNGLEPVLQSISESIVAKLASTTSAGSQSCKGPIDCGSLMAGVLEAGVAQRVASVSVDLAKKAKTVSAAEVFEQVLLCT